MAIDNAPKRAGEDRYPGLHKTSRVETPSRPVDKVSNPHPDQG